jgi:hypothetical protein
MVTAWVDVAISPGSRPMRSQWASRTERRSARAGGSDHMFHSSAWRATTPSIRSPLPPMRIGSVGCTGLGHAMASVTS